MENPCDYDARANMMWASSLSHNDLTGCGRENALPVHQLEHALSGEFDSVAHGAGLAAIWCSWARYVYDANINRWLQYAKNVWNLAIWAATSPNVNPSPLKFMRAGRSQLFLIACSSRVK